MITKKDLENTYSGYSVTELLEIIDFRHNYSDLAVLVALEEIARRKITEEEIATHKQEQIDSVTEKVKRNYVDRLNLRQKHFFFFMWIPFFTFPFKQNFVEDGYDMKLKQARYFSLFGFSSLLMASYLSSQVNLGNFSFWLILIGAFALTLVFDGVFNPVYTMSEREEANEEESNPT